MSEIRSRPLVWGAGAAVLALMVIWAEHDGGYDADTWYWGALVVLALLGGALLSGRARIPSGPARWALVAFSAYTAWSYISIGWAGVPGWALTGSNRTLLYLLLFTLMACLPWSVESAVSALVVFAVGIGVLGIVVLLRLTTGSGLDRLVIDGRLAAPTGYFNSSVALFMMDALLGVTLASRRELPGPLRGALLACACASLQLCVMGQSRGWLFTLPLVLIISLGLVRDRLRVIAATILPLLGTLLPLRRLLHVFQGHSGEALRHAAGQAGRVALLLCAAVLVLGTLAAWGEQIRAPRSLGQRARRRIGLLVACLALAGGVSGILVISHGHPFGFVSRQWRGFTHPGSSIGSSSHFTAVGSGRYDFWRVSLDAFTSHPLGGLGQDNFADYYITRRRTGEDPRWTHSLPMRLLAHTGLVGLLLFGAFLIGALMAARRALRESPPLSAAVAAMAILPLVVWLVHGSVDWFWEVPALTGPTLGFLGIATSLGRRSPTRQAAIAGSDPPHARPSVARSLATVALLVAATAVLGFPYLAVRKTSQAADIAFSNPRAALADLRMAAELDPTSPEPTRLAGTIALDAGLPQVAQQRFAQTIAREPDGWYAWLGEGLAQSTLGNPAQALSDYRMAARINSQQPVIGDAVTRVDTTRPLTPAQALQALGGQ